MKRFVFFILALMPFLFACNKVETPDFPKDELPSIEVYEASNQNLTFTGQKQLHFICDVVLPDQSSFNSIDNPEYFTWDADEWLGARNDGKGWFEFNGTPNEIKIDVVFQKDNVKLKNYIWVDIRE